MDSSPLRNLFDAVIGAVRTLHGDSAVRPVKVVVYLSNGTSWSVTVPAVQPTVCQPPARHSPDFHCVHWYGTVYSFTARQAMIVNLLWTEWLRGVPEVGGDYLLVESGGDKDDARPIGARMIDAFRGNEAWGTMIQSGAKGNYRLVAPPSEATSGIF